MGRRGERLNALLLLSVHPSDSWDPVSQMIKLMRLYFLFPQFPKDTVQGVDR